VTKLSFAQTLEGQVLETNTRRNSFTVRVVEDGLEYTPLLAGKPKVQKCKWIDLVCEQFSETNSFMRQDYSYAVNGSILLALIKQFLAERHAT
jgi:hypothetical protein